MSYGSYWHAEGLSFLFRMVREKLAVQGYLFWRLARIQTDKTAESFLDKENFKSISVEMAMLQAGLFL